MNQDYWCPDNYFQDFKILNSLATCPESGDLTQQKSNFRFPQNSPSTDPIISSFQYLNNTHSKQNPLFQGAIRVLIYSVLCLYICLHNLGLSQTYFVCNHTFSSKFWSQVKGSTWSCWPWLYFKVAFKLTIDIFIPFSSFW